MIKVIIADDEKRVCQLIYNLIYWQEIDMEVVGMAYNGIEALQLINDKKPDIVISDIRMPGYDGIELIRLAKGINENIDFIIISGYSYFEYAQKVIKYGVCDYLLKPIKKEELIETLKKIKVKYNKRRDSVTKEEELKIKLNYDFKKLRKSFLKDLLNSEKEKIFDIKKINEEYYYKFRDGNFQILEIKLDFYNEKEKNELINNKIIDIINKNLSNYCFDIESYYKENLLYFILNYEKEYQKKIRKEIKASLDEVLIQKNIFDNLEITFGMGSLEKNISNIKKSLELSTYSIDERILYPSENLIEIKEIRNNYEELKKIIIKTNNLITRDIEVLDIENLMKNIKGFKNDILEIKNIGGQEIIISVNKIFNIYIESLIKNGLEVLNNDEIIYDFKLNIKNKRKSKDIFDYLNERITESLEKIIQDKKQIETKPIRIAKDYIKQNYMNSISLEEISNLVGFNASYFSSLFKKESGKNFLEYVLEIRINKAKELLKETNKSIYLICESVGYSDIKHFTKNFKKVTGLKPNEYRKLYS